MSAAPRSKSAFEYADVSDDPDAPLWANVPTDVRAAMIRLGFEALGHAHAWHRQGRVHLVHEVRVSENLRTQAVLGASDPTIELASLFEDGTIVKTILRPSKASWMLLAPGMAYDRRDRFFFEAVDGAAADVLRRHQQRLDERVRDTGGCTVALDSMRAHFAIRLRSAELMNAKLPAQIGLSAGAAVACGVLAIIGLTALVVSRFGTDVSVPLLALLGVLAAGIVMIPVFKAMLWWIAPYVVRFWPGPAPSSARELWSRASAIPTRPLPDESEW